MINHYFAINALTFRKEGTVGIAPFYNAWKTILDSGHAGEFVAKLDHRGDWLSVLNGHSCKNYKGLYYFVSWDELLEACPDLFIEVYSL